MSCPQISPLGSSSQTGKEVSLGNVINASTRMKIEDHKNTETAHVFTLIKSTARGGEPRIWKWSSNVEYNNIMPGNRFASYRCQIRPLSGNLLNFDALKYRLDPI